MRGFAKPLFFQMRYHYEKPETYRSRYGRVYTYNHSVYDRCTTFERRLLSNSDYSPDNMGITNEASSKRTMGDVLR